VRSFIQLTLLLLASCSGGSGRPEGPPPPVGDTVRTVVGRIGYQSRAPDLTNRDAHGRLLPQSGLPGGTFTARAPYVRVDLLGDDGRVVGTGHTEEDGRYSIVANFGLNPATPVQVRAIAEAKLPFGTRIRVFADGDALAPYSVTTPPRGDPGTQRSTVMTANADVTYAEGAGAFHMIKVLRPGFVIGRTGLLPGTIVPDMIVHWKPGNGVESKLVPAIEAATVTVAGGITGDDASNTDVWDDAVLMRLHGQYMLDYFLYEVAPEGTPTDAALVPSAAWKEGFLDFWSCLGRGSRVYWDTEGSHSQARVVRFFDIESFFDPSLPVLGIDDPNVYQPADVVGISSRFSIAEMLWDLHDNDSSSNEPEDFQLSPRFTIEILDRFNPGFSYPYLFTLLAGYESTLTLTPGGLELITNEPEDQGIDYPATLDNGLMWPPPISPDGQPGNSVVPPFEKTVSDTVDTINPDPVNLEIGDQTQRYFIIDLLIGADMTLTLTTTGDLTIDLLTQTNAVLATGGPELVVPDLAGLRYVIRVRPADGASPQVADFDLKVELTAP
jgi:hypothetical protein